MIILIPILGIFIGSLFLPSKNVPMKSVFRPRFESWDVTIKRPGQAAEIRKQEVLVIDNPMSVWK